MSLARVDTRYLSLGLAPTSRLYAYAVYDKRFYSDIFRNNSLHAQTMASATFLNREVPYWLQSSITGSPFRGLLLILQKNSMLTDKKIFRSRVGAFRCIVAPYPSRVRNRRPYKVKVVSSDMSPFTIDPCTGQSASSVRANRIV